MQIRYENIKAVYYKDSFNPIMIMLIFYKILVLIFRAGWSANSLYLIPIRYQLAHGL
jgi:hypothetical protein